MGLCYAWEHSMSGNPGNSTFNVPNVDHGTINQDRAPIGWSPVGSANLSGSKKLFGMWCYNQTSGYYAGADAIKVVYSS